MDVGQIKFWAEFIRDVGLILGIPALIGVGVKLYGQQIEILKERNELLKETQYDRALSMIKSQKELFEFERQSLEKSINDREGSLSKSTEALTEKQREIDELRARLQNVSEVIGSLDRSATAIGRTNFAQALFHEDAIFRQSNFRRAVDFSESKFESSVSFEGSLFEAPASFRGAVFRSHVAFDDADLRSGSFAEADLRGVDLSRARIR